MAEPFRFTTGRWFNKLDPETGKISKVPAYRGGFRYDGFGYGTDTPEDFTPPGVPVQPSLICSPSSSLLVIDVDYPASLPASATGELVSWSDAVSTRGSHFHVGVDMRGVAAGDWPAQGRTAWGDVKAAGFVAAPGTVHGTGELYAAAGDWPGKLVPATPELLAALEADKVAYAAAKLADWGIASGGKLPGGAYLYASGYVGGTWKDIPDGALKHHDELKDLVQDMAVFHGIGEGECRREWFRLAGALTAPWEEKHFAAHWKQLPAQRLDQEEKENWTETFGLKLPPTPLEARFTEQQHAYQERTAAAAGFGPATAPPPDGVYEDERDEISWFHYYLGAGPFDGGAPTDAGNAEAVLRRARYALRHDEEADTWLKRTAGRWVQDGDAAREAVTALGRLLPAGCADPVTVLGKDPDADGAEIAALRAQAKNAGRFATSATVNAIAAMMKYIARARSEPWMTVRDSTVDAQPEVLWAGGVPWDLRGCAAGPVRAGHVDRNLPHLHSAACVPDASVPTPLWDQLLDAVWPPRQLPGGGAVRDMQAWAVLVLAAGTTGYPRKVVPLLKGGTDRGKSTVIDAVASVLGTYFRPLNPKVLDAGASTHDTVLMDLKGTRLTFLDEGVKRGTMATARLKRIVGGSSITANRMRQDPVTFRPTHTLAITLNPEETFSFDDPAIDSRVRLLPCNGIPEVVIATARQLDYFHSPAWLAERPGVLAKLMSAAAYLLADAHALDKDRAPAEVERAEQEVKDDEDDVLRWFTEATGECPDGFGSRDLFIAFREWTRETKGDRYYAGSEKKWALRMDELVPEDASRRLYTANKSRLRRRRPLPPGSGGLREVSSPYTAAMFMGGNLRPQPTIVEPVSRTQPTIVESVDSASRPTDPPENPPDVNSQVNAAFTVGQVGQVGRYQSIREKDNTPLHTLEKGTGHNPPPTGTTGSAPAAGVHTDNRPENGEKPQNTENGNSPPAPKTRKPRLSEAERAERAAAKKAQLAAGRDQARAAKVAELGGPLVQLPAVVLRDQRVMPLDAATARAWLAPCLSELSVDVEHSGYQLGSARYRLRLVQLGDEASAVVLDPGDAAQAAVISWALAAARRLHAHSANADLAPLAHAGLGDLEAMWAKMFDTVHPAKLADPALTDSDEAALKPLARALLGPDYALSWKCDQLRKEIFAAGGWVSDTEPDTPAERSGWAQVPLCEAFTRYAAADVMDCAAVWRVLTAGVTQ